MRAPSNGALAGGAIGAALLVLLAIGAPLGRKPPVTPARPEMPQPRVAANGFTLTSAAIELPADDQAFPAGAQADLVTTRCTACHSASMVLSQPALSTEQWTAEVVKMREAYHAPVTDAELPAIVAYLTGLPGQAQARVPVSRPRS